MYCNNCGKQIPDNSKFCNYCGSKIGFLPTDSEKSSNNSIKTTNNKNEIFPDKSIKYLVLSLVVFVPCIYFLAVLVGGYKYDFFHTRGSRQDNLVGVIILGAAFIFFLSLAFLKKRR
jgi:uncharacterized membrane protein YvbJ